MSTKVIWLLYVLLSQKGMDNKMHQSERWEVFANKTSVAARASFLRANGSSCEDEAICTQYQKLEIIAAVTGRHYREESTLIPLDKWEDK